MMMVMTLMTMIMMMMTMMMMTIIMMMICSFATIMMTSIIVIIMIISSADESEHIARCRALGVCRHLRKPVTRSNLYEALIGALGVTTMPDPGAKVPTAEKSLQILLVEDNAFNQKVAIGLLENRGHPVETAGDGRQALDLLAATDFDLALMDLEMAKMDGIEATRNIRARERSSGQHLPIIGLTAHTMKGDRERFLAAGMDGYVAKPVRPRELYEVVEGVAAMVEREEAAPPSPNTSGLPYHWETALERVGGKEDMLRDLAEMFFEECPRLIQQIREHIASENGAELRRVAHTLKGSAHVFGAEGAAAAAFRLEEMGQAGVLAGAVEALALLEVQVGRLVPALREKLAG